MDFSLLIFLAPAAAYFVFALKKIEEAVFALPLFFPLYLWKGTVAGVPFTLVEMLIYAVFLAYLVRGIFDACRVKKSSLTRSVFNIFKNEGEENGLAAILREKFWPPILLMVAGAIGGVLMAKQSVLLIDGVTPFYGRKVALGILKAWIVCPIVMFVLFRLAVRKSGDILKMLNYYTISAIVLSIWGLAQVAMQNYITPDARASGPFESANYLALYIAPAVLYMAVRIKESVSPAGGIEKYSFWNMPFRRRKAPLERPEIFFFLAGFLTVFLAIMFTKSYAAILSVFFAAVFYFGLEYREYRKKKAVSGFPWKVYAAVAAVVAVILIAVFFIDSSKLGSILRFQDRNSSSVRVEVYTIAANLVKENWLTGIGPGQFPAYYQLEAERILGRAPYEWNMLHPHNLYIAFWLNLGLAGFAGFVWLLYLMVAACRNDFEKFAIAGIKEQTKIRVMGFTLLLTVLLHGLFDTPFFKNDLSLLFWLITAVILLPKEKWTKS
jgi:O-antigen ligase